MNASRTFLRPHKRPRVEMYQKGAVLKVRVQNFMTYADAEIVPGPKLNLVLGPNGTGKSSLVCALCVGLAGSTRLLGRAEDMSSFVRRGTRRGWVEVTLSSGDSGPPYVIKRTISADNNSSEWQLNGRDCTMKEVKEVVEKLHVQLDNLCQFLPQDKVVEFARMKPVQLLHATEQAIGNGELFEQHQALIQERAQLWDHEAAAEAVAGSLARLQDEQARNERTVAQMRKRKELLVEVDDMKKKLPWLEYQAAKDEYDVEKGRLEAVQRQLKEREAAQKLREGPLKEKRKLAERLERQRTEARKVSQELEKKVVGGGTGANSSGGLDERLQDTMDGIDDKERELEGLAQQSRNRLAKIQKLEQDIEKKQRDLESLPADSTPEIVEEKRRLQAEQTDVNTQLLSLREQLQEVQEQRGECQRLLEIWQRRVQQLEDAKMQRLRMLEERNRGITKAWRWLQLQQNRQNFKGRVYGPILAEVECPNPQHAQYLEQHVSNAVWSFFVTEFREDQDTLRRELGRECGFTPNISNFNGNADEPIRHPDGEASQYARYHIVHTLDEVFTAPGLVKHVLCEESGINKSYVGTEQTQTLVERLLAETRQLNSLWVPEAHYSRRFSEYNPNAQSTAVYATRPCRLLSKQAPGEQVQEKEQAEVQIRQLQRDMAQHQEQYSELEGQYRGVQQKLAQVESQLKAISDRVQQNANRRRQLSVKLTTDRKMLQRLRDGPDPLGKEPELRRKLQQLRDQAFQLAKEIAQLVVQLGDSMPHLIALELSLKEAREQEEAYGRANRDTARELDRLKGLVRQYEARVRDLQVHARAKKQEAEEVALLTEELQQKFAAMPDTVQQLQREMDQKYAEAEGICINNPAALEEYNRRLQEIHRQEGELAQLKDKVELSRRRIEDTKALWLPRLQQVVSSINTAFTASFALVGCAGEVVLREVEGEDFAHYAIEIRVKFREEEELQTLDANRQSGGERSVSTMLYLISLQGVTITPFRVVDEINQGMDPINERKIFNLLVRAACRGGTPQCFLLTPKLLPDLPFTRDVRVLQIMNGPFIQDVASNFSWEKLLGSQRMSQLVASQ